VGASVSSDDARNATLGSDDKAASLTLGTGSALLERLGISPCLIRLSVGLEDSGDLWDNFSQTLKPA
jgi:cystathionine beta-lyase/cystathionine gamma-synthase